MHAFRNYSINLTIATTRLTYNEITDSKVDIKRFIAILKKIWHETFNGMQRIVVGRSLHCGPARTNKRECLFETC